jgi:hypothetical protein
MAQSVDDRLTELERQVQSFKNTARVLGTVAVIFGISGAWGWSAMSAAQDRIVALQGQVEKVEEVFRGRSTAAEASFRAALDSMTAQSLASMSTSRDQLHASIQNSADEAIRRVVASQPQAPDISSLVMEVLRRERVVTGLTIHDSASKTNPFRRDDSRDSTTYSQPVAGKYLVWSVFKR